MIIKSNLDFEEMIKSNPTYHFFLRETKIDYAKFDYQIGLKCSVALIAIMDFICQKYGI